MIFYRRGRRERRGDMGFYHRELRGVIGFYRSEFRGGHVFLPQRTQRAQRGYGVFTAESFEGA